LANVIVSAGPVDTLFEPVEVVNSKLGKFDGARCKACGQIFLCASVKTIPPHTCSGFSIVGSVGAGPEALIEGSKRGR